MSGTSNIIPRYSDFQIIFSSITKDDVILDFSTVTRWHFSIANNVTTGTPILKLNSTDNSGYFTIATGTRTVTVAIGSSGFEASGGSYGNYYVALWADTSGSFVTHEQKVFTIQQQIKRI